MSSGSCTSSCLATAQTRYPPFKDLSPTTTTNITATTITENKAKEALPANLDMSSTPQSQPSLSSGANQASADAAALRNYKPTTLREKVIHMLHLENSPAMKQKRDKKLGIGPWGQI